MAVVISHSHLSNAALLQETARLAANERSSTGALIAALSEVDSRRLYLAEGYSCMFLYCTNALRLSESAAYSRIEAARIARAFPQILPALNSGALNLTTTIVVAPHLTVDNVDELIGAASFKRKQDVERLIAERHPKPDVATVVRKQPAGRPIHTAAEPASIHEGLTPATAVTNVAMLPNRTPAPAVLAPLSASTYKIQFTADQETHDQLRHAQALLRHQIISGDINAIIKRALTLLIADVERKKVAAVMHPRPLADGRASTSRHIPAAIRRAVWERDKGRCAFVGARGRCPERGLLEFHHVVPFATGGTATIENIELRCRAHNAHEAALVFG